MKTWAASRWEALTATDGVFAVACFLVAAALALRDGDWDGFNRALLWLALAAYYTEWQHSDHRYKKNAKYIERGQEVEHKIQAARERGHGNILITFK